MRSEGVEATCKEGRRERKRKEGREGGMGGRILKMRKECRKEMSEGGGGGKGKGKKQRREGERRG